MATGVGIDIGSQFVKVVKVAVTGNKVSILAAAKIPREKKDPDDAAARKAVAALKLPPDLGQRLKTLGVGTAGTAGITGREVNLKYVFIPPVPPEKLRMLMDMELGGKIGSGKAALQEGPAMTYDWRILNTPAGLNSDMTIMAGSVRTEVLLGHMQALSEAGLKVEAVTPSSFGLVHAYLGTQGGDKSQTEGETVVVCDVGHEWLEIAVIEGQSVFFARCGPGGGKKFNEALDKVLQTGPDRAAVFKHERARIYPEGVSVRVKQDEAFQPALREGADAIAAGIRAAVMFCRTQAKLPKLDFKTVYISGGGAKVKGLLEYLEKKLARPVQPLNLSTAVNLSKLTTDGAQLFEGAVSEMAVAVGLAIIDAKPKLFHFRFIPESVLARRVFWRKTALGIAAGVIVMASLVYPYLNAQKAAARAADVAQDFQDRDQKAHAEKKEFQKDIEKNKILAATIDYHARLTRSGRIYAELLKVIRAATPPNVTLNYVGPGNNLVEDNPNGQAIGIGPGLGPWNVVAAPVSDIVIRGEYDKEAYPEVPVATINKAWLDMRTKILQVPGVQDAVLSALAEFADKQALAAMEKRGKKPFEAKLNLQDMSKPLKVWGEPAVKP